MRILLADDEPIIRGLYREMLEGNRHLVETASNGDEVLGKLAESAFDLLILDLHMPKMDGFVALREMRRRNLRVPAIIMTGHYPNDEVRHRIEGLGVAEILRKPVKITVMQQAVDRVLSMRPLPKGREGAGERG